MTLDPQQDGRFLRELYGRLKDEPLQPDSPYYEPVFDELKLDDPVQSIATRIEFDGDESLRLFSGFRGAGKTTELFRLRRRLEADGYVVLYADALEYLNAAVPVEIGEVLVAIAGAFGDALEKTLGEHPDVGGGFWQRLQDFVSRIHVTGANVTAGAGAAGAKAGIDLKFELRASTNLRDGLKIMLANSLRELKSEVDACFADGIARIRADRGEDVGVVFLFDNLEQLRGTLQNESEMIRAVERVFSVYLELLRIPGLHAVYTVPPWLKFVLPGGVPITLLPTVHLWTNDPDRSDYEPAWTVFRAMMARRIDEEARRRLFGDAAMGQAQIDRLIAVCGGQFRDLLRLLRDMLVRANGGDRLPMGEDVVTGVINAARRDFLPIAREDAQWLDRIARSRATALESTEPEPVNRLARFLDNHFVLYFINADEWYDIHPLIRAEVAKIVARQPDAPAG